MKKGYLTLGLFITLVILGIISLFVGVIDIDINGLLSGDADAWFIFLVSRLPRLLAIICTGMGMSVAGLIMQKLCMNRFVAPSTGATMAGARFGILISMIYLREYGLVSRSIFAFICAILATWIFVAFVQYTRFKDVVMVPLVGIMFGNVIGALTSFLAYHYELTQSLSAWQVGSFALIIRGRYELVWLCLPLVILAFIFANHFNIVGMGKDFSKNLGVSYNFILYGGLAICAMISASVVVVVGSISYIGLIIPNIVTMFRGDRIRGTLIDTALFGCLFVLICDMLARVVIVPYEMPIELISGILGSIIFVVMLMQRLRGSKHA